MASFQKQVTPVDLMRAEAPVHRSCLEANIPVEFCTCLPWQRTTESAYTVFMGRAKNIHQEILRNVSALMGNPRLCEPVEVDEASVVVEVQRWPTEYKPKEQPVAKRMWMMPNRDMVRVHYRTRGGAAFVASFSVDKLRSDLFDLARIDRIDAMRRKCGVIEKTAEHLCVCQ
jgi:hypothetical protein